MSVGILAILFIVSLMVVLFTGLPVAFTLIGLSILFAIIFVGPAAAFSSVYILFSTVTKDIYIAAPLFCFMAYVLEFSGVATALYDAMHKWFAGLRGGLSMGTVAICAIIAAMTGIGATGTVTMGVIAYPEMMRRKYDKDMALGAIAFGGTLGPLIPPSVLMIIVGGYASLSVGKLFMGGVFPGIIMAVLAMTYIGVRSYLRPTMGPALAPHERASWTEKFVSLRGLIAPIVLIILVIGSIYAGAATASEAGGFGAFGALVCAAIYRQLNWSNLRKAGLGTLKLTSMIMFLLIGGGCFASLLKVTGAGSYISDVMSGFQAGPIFMLAVMLLVSLILGMFIDPVAITIICIPIFMPIVFQLNIDPLWFALLFIMSLVIGYATPPFGMNLFYTKGVVPPDITMSDIYRSILPYVVVGIGTLALCVVFPEILLWLPSMMIK